MIQRILAWTLHKADTKINEVFHIKKKKKTKLQNLLSSPFHMTTRKLRSWLRFNCGNYVGPYAYNPSLVALRIKRLPAMQETQVWSLGWEDPLEKEMATHSSVLAWRIPWTEEPGGLQSMGSQRVRHDWATSLSFYAYNYRSLGLVLIFYFIFVLMALCIYFSWNYCAFFGKREYKFLKCNSVIHLWTEFLKLRIPK